ncbi:MAG: hypothetical protein WAZ27_05135 [Minisyncoccia bacterium]
MSLPSIPNIAKDFGVDLSKCSGADRERILVEAMRRDMPLAVSLLHTKAHEAVQNGGHADWLEDPNSVAGKQLIRLHASDALRPLASKHFCHGKRLTFVNCCKGIVGEPPEDEEDLLDLQIKTQAGPIAYADC